MFCRRCGLAVRAPARPVMCGTSRGGPGRTLRTLFLVILFFSISRWTAHVARQTPPPEPANVPAWRPSSPTYPRHPAPPLRMPDGRWQDPARDGPDGQQDPR